MINIGTILPLKSVTVFFFLQLEDSNITMGLESKIIFLL